MRIFIYTFFALFYLNSFSQIEVGYLVDKDENVVKLYKNEKNLKQSRNQHLLTGDISVTNEYFWYYDAKGEFKYIKQKKIKQLRYGEQEFIIMPIVGMKRRKRLHTMIAKNNDFVLTNYYSGGYNYFYIFRLEDKKGMTIKNAHSLKKKTDLKYIEKKIKKYFSDCPELIKALEDGVNSSDYEASRYTFKGTERVYVPTNFLFSKVTNYSCEK